MKLRAGLMGFVLLFLLSGCSDPTPDVVDLHHRSFSVSDLKGKWIVINVWAPWCASCVNEMPELNRFYQHKTKDVEIYGVNFDGSSEAETRDSAVKLGIQFPILVGNVRESLHLPVTDVLPITFIMDPSGKVVRQLVGPNTEQSLTHILSQLKSA